MQEPLLSGLQDLVQSFQGTADRLTTGVETNLEALMQKQLRDATVFFPPMLRSYKFITCLLFRIFTEFLPRQIWKDFAS